MAPEAPTVPLLGSPGPPYSVAPTATPVALPAAASTIVPDAPGTRAPGGQVDGAGAGGAISRATTISPSPATATAVRPAATVTAVFGVRVAEELAIGRR